MIAGITCPTLAANGKKKNRNVENANLKTKSRVKTPEMKITTVRTTAFDRTCRQRRQNLALVHFQTTGVWERKDIATPTAARTGTSLTTLSADLALHVSRSTDEKLARWFMFNSGFTPTTGWAIC